MDLDKLSTPARPERRVAMPLEALPDGLVARAMERIALDAAAGRARAVAAPPVPMWRRLARGEIVRPRALRLAGALAVALALVGALAAVWLSLGAPAREAWLLQARVVGLEARLMLRSSASPLLPALAMGAAALACALLSLLDGGPRAERAPLHPVA